MLEDLSLPTAVKVCRIVTIADSLEPTDRGILLAAVGNDDWGTMTLSKELRKRGITISDKLIRNHRIKSCRCFDA